MAGTTGPSAAPAGRVRWRRRLLYVLLVIAGFAALDHAVGLRTLEFAGGGLLGATLLGLYLWRGPRLHRHFRSFRGGERRTRSRTGSLNYPSQKGLHLPSVKSRRRAGGVFAGGTMGGGRRRPAMAPFRRAGGAGPRSGLGRSLGRSRSRSLGLAGGRRRQAAALAPARRRNGAASRSAAARRRTPLSGRTGRLAGSSRRTSSPFRRTAAGRRGTSGGLRGSRRGSGAFRGSRGGSPGFRRTAAGRRAAPHPGVRRILSGRRPAVVPGGRGGRRAGASPGTGRARAIRRTARRAAFGPKHPYGTAAAGGWKPARLTGLTPRSRRRAMRPWTWFRRPAPVPVTRKGRPKHPPLPPPRRPLHRRVRRAVRRRYRAARKVIRKAPFKTPAPVRYVLWHLRGRPGMKGSRGTRRRALLAKRKAAIAKLLANPRLRRHRVPYAPWRIAPGRRMRFRPWLRTRRARLARSRFLRRWRRGRTAPRTRQGVPLTRRARLARWLRIRRGRPTPGTVRLGRPRPRLRYRIAGWAGYVTGHAARRVRPRNWRWLRRRRGRAPRPLGGIFARLDRRRMDRWRRRHQTATVMPRAGARGPSGPGTPAGGHTVTWHGSALGGFTGTGTGGRPMASLASSVADEIEALGGWDPEGPRDLHDTLRSLSSISGEAGSSLGRIGTALEDSGLDASYAETLHEAAGSLFHHEGELDRALGGGLTSQNGDGSGNVMSSSVLNAVNEIRDLGGWEPDDDDPEGLHETITSLAAVIHGVASSYQQIGWTVGQTGAHASYPKALEDASAAIGSVADAVDQAFAGGVMRRPGG